jgi:ketosteroid isomerase-like protein
MATTKTRAVEAVVRRFDEAWQRADIDALMSLVSDDCVYGASVGPGPGREFVGKAEVRRGFLAMLTFDQSDPAAGQVVMVDETRALVMWTVHQKATGGTVAVRGCDVFEVHDGLIRRKDAFRKSVS